MAIDFKLDPECLRIVDTTKPAYPGGFVSGFEVWLISPQLELDILVASCSTRAEADRVVANFHVMWEQLHLKRN